MGVGLDALSMMQSLCSIQHTVFCPYPPDNYTLVVEDPEGNITDTIVEAIGSVIGIVVNDLMEDTQYLYYVMATNQFGSSTSSSVGICKFFVLFTSIYHYHN